MKYKIIYDSIIQKAKNLEEHREKLKKTKLGYYERHHIIPKCMGGDNSKENLVLLTYREHFLCHWLLVKINRDSNIKVRSRLANAFRRMCQHNGKNKNRRYTSKMYDVARKNWIENHHTKDPEIRAKISESSKLRKKRPLLRETRYCKCGCSETFECHPNNNKLYLHGHKRNNKESNNLISKRLSETLKKMSTEDMLKRLQNSTLKADQKERGRKISLSKKGKKTNQIQIMGERFVKMSDDEFALYISDKSKYVRTRFINIRNKFLEGQNI